MDPLFSLTLIFLFAGFWSLAAAKKMRHPTWFAIVLNDYAILPKILVKPASILIPIGEIGIVISLILNPKLGAVLSVALLVLYALILSFNGLRGNKIEDCGCSWGMSKNDEISSLSYTIYILRNMGLACLISLVLMPISVRALTVLDWTNAVLMSVFITMTVLVFSALFSNHKSLKVFRHG